MNDACSSVRRSCRIYTRTASSTRLDARHKRVYNRPASSVYVELQTPAHHGKATRGHTASFNGPFLCRTRLPGAQRPRQLNVARLPTWQKRRLRPAYAGPAPASRRRCGAGLPAPDRNSVYRCGPAFLFYTFSLLSYRCIQWHPSTFIY